MDLQLAEATFWSFLNNLNEGVILLEDHGAVLHVNPRAQELLQIYYPVHHLSEIYQAAAADDPWERWTQLLSPPHTLFLEMPIGEVTVEAKALVWQGNRLIQLLLNGHASDPNDCGPCGIAILLELKPLHAVRWLSDGAHRRSRG